MNKIIKSSISIFLISFLVLLNACQKDVLRISPNKLANIEIKSKVDFWISQQKVNVDYQKSSTVDLLLNNLNFSALSVEKFDDGDQFIIIPILPEFSKIKNVDKAIRPYLIVLADESGVIQKSNILLYTPEEKFVIDKFPPNTFYNIFSKKQITCSGDFKFLSITGRRLFEMDYENGLLKSFSQIKPKLDANGQNSLSVNNCTDWYLVTTYHYPDGTTYQTSQYVGTTCEGGGCYDSNLESICPDNGGGGGGSVGEIFPNENVNAADKICESSFKFKKYSEPTNGVGGWRLAGTTNIHMQVVDLVTGQYRLLALPTIYFGVPVIRLNGEFYSEGRAKEIAAEAVEYAEQKVMEYYNSIGGSINYASMTLYYRQKINEKMESYGGSASLSSGSNINVTEFGEASYGWPWPILCL